VALIWEKLQIKGLPWMSKIMRAKIPGGWLVLSENGFSGGITFVPDPNHEWNGESLPTDQHIKQ